VRTDPQFGLPFGGRCYRRRNSGQEPRGTLDPTRAAKKVARNPGRNRPASTWSSGPQYRSI
jgi:hypothetical protein